MKPHPGRAARTLLFALAATVFLGSVPTGPAWSASAREIDIKVEAALERFHRQVSGANEFMAAAKGVLIFPDVIEAGFIFGGEYGEGVLRIGDRNVAYYSTAGASVGFQAGAQSKVIMVVFMDAGALERFRNSRGWQVGVDGSVAIIELGVGGRIDSNNIRDPIVGFIFGNKGLMAGVSLEGSKFTRLDK